MKKLVFSILLILSTTTILFGQQSVPIAHHMFTKLAVNPAYAGAQGGICVNGIVRQQWVGIKDQTSGENVYPETFLIGVDAPIRMIRGALGGIIMQDKLGFYKDISVNLGYTYHTNFLQGELGIGTQIVFTNRSIDGSKFDPIQGDDPLLASLTGEASDMLLDFNLGLYYEVPGRYYVGVSATNLLETRGKSLGDDGTGISPVLDRTLYVMGGYVFPFPGNPLLDIKTSLQLQSNVTNSLLYLDGLLEYNKRFWGGLSYRAGANTPEALSVLIGMNYKDFRIGYAYDVPLTAVSMSGTHEIMVGYCFKIQYEGGIKSYRNTRFL